MKIIAILVFLALPASVVGQKTFSLNDASKSFNVIIKAERCDENSCEGKAVFSLYKKNSTRPFQEIDIENTSISLNRFAAYPQDVALRYLNQSVLRVGDFNFDGLEDLAIQDGKNGPYGGASFAIHIFDPRKGRFIHNKEFSEVAELGGMFEVKKKTRNLVAAYVIGCCTQISERYDVVKGRPRKIFEEKVELGEGGGKDKVTTKTLAGGKWRTSVKLRKGGK